MAFRCELASEFEMGMQALTVILAELEASRCQFASEMQMVMQGLTVILSETETFAEFRRYQLVIELGIGIEILPVI